MKIEKIKYRLLDIVLRILLFSILWLILTNGDPSSWLIGAPAILFAVIASTRLVSPVPLIWSEVPGFIAFFLIRSLAAGADVAYRVLHPLMPIAPDLVTYPLRIPPGLPQVFMANTVSLMPGTLSADLNQNILKVHILDKEKNFMTELESVERRVARMFGVSLQHEGRKQ
ncbi:Na+/H+ antiporter subunit E [Nitrosomonas sp. Nm51]|uniref:Na+/H+ antiporter subunit E n=1 Tax=Nitrosomonas sp. Nm51 TaxID=133720 RepID=UPI001C42EECC|nr:Na+/H+ antiporter subunit E [Nitrosomonas sp. Nm51]